MLGAAAHRIVHAIRKPGNNADEAIAAKPGGTGLSGRSAVSRRSPMGIYHWLRVASCVSSRKAAVATTRGLCRGSLAQRQHDELLVRWSPRQRVEPPLHVGQCRTLD